MTIYVNVVLQRIRPPKRMKTVIPICISFDNRILRRAANLNHDSHGFLDFFLDHRPACYIRWHCWYFFFEFILNGHKISLESTFLDIFDTNSELKGFQIWVHRKWHNNLNGQRFCILINVSRPLFAICFKKLFECHILKPLNEKSKFNVLIEISKICFAKLKFSKTSFLPNKNILLLQI